MLLSEIIFLRDKKNKPKDKSKHNVSNFLSDMNSEQSKDEDAV